MKKNIFRLIVVIGILSLLVFPVAAASYTGTYNMTGGIFCKRAFDSGVKMTIIIKPDTGTYDCNMGIYTAKNRTIFGWTSVDHIASVSSIFYSESKYTTTEAIDGLYFRNWSGGFRWTGSFEIQW